MTSIELGESNTATTSSDQIGYYGLPVIHRPHWKWLIICYFFLGGISGTAAVLSAITRLVDRTDGPRIARVATYVSAAALLPCPILLILDLGRPARFLNMLRVLRPTSPMSIGSWGLAFYGGATFVATTLQVLHDLAARDRARSIAILERSVRLIAVASALLGVLVAGYTGVLLATTAVPLWSKRPRILGPLFLCSATTSSTAAVAITLSFVDPSAATAEAKLRRFEALTVAAEAVLLTGWIYALGSTAKPLAEGHVGVILRHVVVGAGIAVPQMIAAFTDSSNHRLPGLLLGRVASILTLIGGFALRYVVVQAGRDSADDPQATFDMTR